jgi:hypothetical protein
LTPGIKLRPGPADFDPAGGPVSGEDSEAESEVNLRPGVNLGPDPFIDPPLNLDPGLNLTGGPAKKRTFAIREAKLAQDGHARAEQHLYEMLWERARPHDEVSRLITIGFAGIAKLVRLSESNARINLRSLIQKLAIEEYSTYNCEQSTGRTYRILNYSEILRRRREAGYTWVMRKTLAVSFVDPATGEPLLSKPKKKAGPGLKLTGGPPPNLTGGPGLNLGGAPGLNLTGAYREEELENLSREVASSVPVLYEHLSQYGHPDDDVIQRLFLACRREAADCTVDEIVHFIHHKGAVAARLPVHNAMGFLLTAVPKCFCGESFTLYRATAQRERAAQQAQRRREEAELEQWRQEQQALLADPAVDEQEKQWIRKLLRGG